MSRIATSAELSVGLAQIESNRPDWQINISWYVAPRLREAEMPYCRFLGELPGIDAFEMRHQRRPLHRSHCLPHHQRVITHKADFRPTRYYSYTSLSYNDAEARGYHGCILEDGHANFTKHVPAAKPQQVCA